MGVKRTGGRWCEQGAGLWKSVLYSGSSWWVRGGGVWLQEGRREGAEERRGQMVGGWWGVVETLVGGVHCWGREGEGWGVCKGLYEGEVKW